MQPCFPPLVLSQKCSLQSPLLPSPPGWLGSDVAVCTRRVRFLSCELPECRLRAAAARQTPFPVWTPTFPRGA